MAASHRFTVNVNWVGNLGTGTDTYGSYSRDHVIGAEEKTDCIAGSSAARFRGDPTRYNPEELLIASLSTCHMLWYLHLCADAGVVVTEYADRAEATLEFHGGVGRFTEALLRPAVRVADRTQRDEAERLHARAHEMCFIARSVNFPVRCEPHIL